MKSVYYRTNDGRDVEIVTRSEVLKAMLEAKTYINRRYSNASMEILRIKDAKEEIEAIEKKIPEVQNNKPEDLDILLNEVINLIAVMKLEKRKRVLETAINVYDYIYNNEAETRELYGREFLAIKDKNTGHYIYIKSFEEANIVPDNWDIDDAFATKFATYLFNKINSSQNGVSESEYLSIEREYNFNNKKKGKNTKKRK